MTEFWNNYSSLKYCKMCHNFETVGTSQMSKCNKKCCQRSFLIFYDHWIQTWLSSSLSVTRDSSPPIASGSDLKSFVESASSWISLQFEIESDTKSMWLTEASRCTRSFRFPIQSGISFILLPSIQSSLSLKTKLT